MASANLSDVASKLESVLQCAICLDLFKDPRILICGHVFCDVCIHRLIGPNGIRCPTCRHVSDLADITEVFVLNDVVDVQKSIATHLCDLCKNGTVMDDLWRCDGCEVKMTCSKCMVKNNHGFKCEKSPLSLAEYLAEKQNQLIEWRHTIYQGFLDVNFHIDRFSAQKDEMYRRILTIRDLVMGDMADQNGKKSMAGYLARTTAIHTLCEVIMACFRSEISAIHDLANPLIQMSAAHPSDLDVNAMEEWQDIMAEVGNRLNALPSEIDGKLMTFQGCFAASEILYQSMRGVLDGQAPSQATAEVMISDLGIPIPIDGVPVNLSVQVDDSIPVIDSEGPTADHSPVDAA